MNQRGHRQSDSILFLSLFRYYFLNEEEEVVGKLQGRGERGRKGNGCNTSKVEKLLVHGCKKRQGNRSERDIKITIGKRKRRERGAARERMRRGKGSR